MERWKERGRKMSRERGRESERVRKREKERESDAERARQIQRGGGGGEAKELRRDRQTMEFTLYGRKGLRVNVNANLKPDTLCMSS